MKLVSLTIGITIGVLLMSLDGRAQRLPRGFVHGALCIHQHEGSWHDSGAPYWGGMQMDMQFMRTYGPRLLRRRGTADNWTPHQQLVVAYHAWRRVGWSPWPNTARICGL